MSINTYLIGSYVFLRVWRKFARKPNMLRSEYLLPLCPISTLSRACMRRAVINFSVELRVNSNVSYGVQVNRSSLHAQDFSLTMMVV
jgi:hypothetical protein